MNSSNICHEIEGCPGLYVDAFRGQYLRKTHESDSAFILTHYHGDHYGSLPREGKYQGPALIHCTPVTAALLVSVHDVPAAFIVEHHLGETFQFQIRPNIRRRRIKQQEQLNEYAKVTFYDANHCPGACVAVIQLHTSDGTISATHLHTGDMRYHSKMKSYPLLSEAVINRTLDIVYLDTTYGHPKHDFCPQHDAIEAIASQTEQLFLSPEEEFSKAKKFNDDDASSSSDASCSTLVLLSCYSIGKEKILWEAANRTGQLLYVSEKKLKMLKCIQGSEADASTQIHERCTTDPSLSDIHVIPMGLAGEMWPYFRPNYNKCAEYASKLDKHYHRVVAFLPTGWANGSNWNKNHSINRKRVDYRKINSASSPSSKSASETCIDVEIRLISYSEHSSFLELEEFVQFLKPRKVIPTVFSDDAQYRAIERRFQNMLDMTRVKQAFFRSMGNQMSSSSPCKNNLDQALSSTKAFSTSAEVSDATNQQDTSGNDVEVVDLTKLPSSSASLQKSYKQQPCIGVQYQLIEDNCQDTARLKGVETVDLSSGGSTAKSLSLLASTGSQSKVRNEIQSDGVGRKLEILSAMGFRDRALAEVALKRCKGNVNATVEELLSMAKSDVNTDSRKKNAITADNNDDRVKAKKKKLNPPKEVGVPPVPGDPIKTSKTPLITSFFTRSRKS